MTAAERRLAATAACLAGARGASLLARGPATAAQAEASRLAGLPRGERLHALAAVLGWTSPEALGARAREVAGRERPRTAALISRLGQGGAPGPGISPALVRLVRERLSSP